MKHIAPTTCPKPAANCDLAALVAGKQADDHYEYLEIMESKSCAED